MAARVVARARLAFNWELEVTEYAVIDRAIIIKLSTPYIDIFPRYLRYRRY